MFYCLRFETSLFVASYDSQVHGGGIRPRLHTGFSRTSELVPVIISRLGPCRKHRSLLYSNRFFGNVFFLRRRYPVTAVYTCLLRISYLAKDVVLLFVSRSLPSNGSTRYNILEALQQREFLSGDWRENTKFRQSPLLCAKTSGKMCCNAWELHTNIAHIAACTGFRTYVDWELFAHVSEFYNALKPVTLFNTLYLHTRRVNLKCVDKFWGTARTETRK
jgi:hypothetical protein